jgi:hypothetical protein
VLPTGWRKCKSGPCAVKQKLFDFYPTPFNITEEANMEKQFNPTNEDLGNCVALEHVNTAVPDQQIATLFYVAGLGLTRDPDQHVDQHRPQPDPHANTSAL